MPIPLVRWVAHSEPVSAIDRALADARVVLGDVARELGQIQAIAAVNASYWDASTREGNAGADAWQAVCDFVRTTYGLSAYTALTTGKNPHMNGLIQQRPFAARGPMDALLARVRTLLQRQHTTEAHVAQLEADRSAVIALVAGRVAEAVKAAGGQSAVTAAVHSGLALVDALPPEPAELADITTELVKLDSSGVTDGPAVDSLRARRQELVDQAATQRVASAHNRKTRAVELVRTAIAGGELARAELEQLAARVPRAFPAGFAATVAGARFDRAVIAELGKALAA